MSTTHARRTRLGRFADLFRHDDARPPRPVINAGGPGFEVPVLCTPDPAPSGPKPGRARQDWGPAPEPVTGPVHMVADETAVMPCCGQSETQVPQTDYVTGNPRLVTCRSAAHDTMLDNRAPMPRSYVPEPHTPDLCQDLADLEVFRETLGTRTRRHPAGCTCGHPVECLCGHPVAGETWAERMVRVGIHLLTSEGAVA